MAELKKDQKPKKTISKRLMPDQVAYSRIETMPGRQAQVDWAVFKITEPSGRTSTVYLFLMLLGYCRAMYGEFVQRCTLESFLDCHKRAFRYLGGVPDEVLYDNMQIHFNINLQHLAHHFGFTPKVCPPYCSWVKTKVERSVDYIHESFWRGYGFNSIEQANRDLFAWLDTVANTRVHASHRQAIAERWQKEKASLRMLPPSEYDTSLKIFRMVLKNCLIRFDANWYKLPHAAVGKMIRLKIKDGTIRFFDDDRLLASYPQSVGIVSAKGNPLFTATSAAPPSSHPTLHRLAGALRGPEDYSCGIKPDIPKGSMTTP